MFNMGKIQTHRAMEKTGDTLCDGLVRKQTK